MGVERITSRQHALVERCRRLARRRTADDPVLLDGAHLVADALAANVPLEAVLHRPGAAADLVSRARRAGAEVREATAAVLDAASPVRESSGILALAWWRAAGLDDLFAAATGSVIALVGVQDPGNLGGAIRCADALGAAGVLALDESADPAGWKALRGAMGSTFRVAVAHGSSADALPAARRTGFTIAATAGGAGLPLHEAALPARTVFLLGNEGRGLPPGLLQDADLHVQVPMRAGVDSLNVAVTAALILYELGRRREQAPVA